MRRLLGSFLASALLTGTAFADEVAVTPPPLPTGPSAPPVTLQLRGVVTEGAAPIAEAIEWRVYRAAAGQRGEAVAEQSAAQARLQVPPGQYVVVARYRDTEVSREIIASSGTASQVIDFRAGFLTFGMIETSGAKPIQEPISWEVYRYRQGGVREEDRIASAVAANQLFVLGEGHYVVRGRYDDITTDLVVPVTPGIRHDYTVNLYAGTVGMRAAAENGAEVAGDVTWDVFKLDKNGERTPLASHTGKTTKFMLREGRYLVVARAGAMAGEATFEVRSGRTDKLKVVLKDDPTAGQGG